MIWCYDFEPYHTPKPDTVEPDLFMGELLVSLVAKSKAEGIVIRVYIVSPASRWELLTLGRAATR